ncbi:Protein ENHANCED DISEASE RESISTANCE 2, C-terminal [Dillenia turbinata]|uniref:Protein ENHANCED DISEASE RESISTANCE 2, C-terminal n=1 Tax=Dillenia turbinata TaxID=194707 RepID=A0AAN8ZBL9_9MAGN
MCPTKQKHRTKISSTNEEQDHNNYDWREETINGGSLPLVDLNTGSNGWASPPGNLFSLRSKQYLTKKIKAPAGEYLLKPTAVDWLKSSTRLDNVLALSDNRVSQSLKKAHSLKKALKTFIFAVNLQIPGKDQHSAVFYFSTDEPIQPGSLLYRFINGDDQFRNQRFKLVNRIVKGPWILKAAVGNYAACLLGKALTCRYFRGENYLEIDVDIGTSAIASAILHLALGHVRSVTIDMGFVVEGQEDEELPEKLIGAVRICQMEMESATVVKAEDAAAVGRSGCGGGSSKVNNHEEDSCR